MEQTTFTTTVLRASEGHKLTQVDESTPLMERAAAKVVCIGKHDSASNWKEISDEEASEIIAAKEAARIAEDERLKAEQEEGGEV